MKSVNFEISGRFFSYCCVLVDFVSIALESLFEAFRCAECRMPKKTTKCAHCSFFRACRSKLRPFRRAAPGVLPARLSFTCFYTC